MASVCPSPSFVKKKKKNKKADWDGGGKAHNAGGGVPPSFDLCGTNRKGWIRGKVLMPGSRPQPSSYHSNRIPWESRTGTWILRSLCTKKRRRKKSQKSLQFFSLTGHVFQDFFLMNKIIYKDHCIRCLSRVRIQESYERLIIIIVGVLVAGVVIIIIIS